MGYCYCFFFFFSSRRRHTRWNCDWSSDVCSSDLQCIYQHFYRACHSIVFSTTPQSPLWFLLVLADREKLHKQIVQAPCFYFPILWCVMQPFFPGWYLFL